MAIEKEWVMIVRWSRSTASRLAKVSVVAPPPSIRMSLGSTSFSAASAIASRSSTISFSRSTSAGS